MFSDDDGVENPGSWEHERQQPVKPTVRRQVHEWSEAPGLVEQAPAMAAAVGYRQTSVNLVLWL
jgi:hypothetical protein